MIIYLNEYKLASTIMAKSYDKNSHSRRKSNFTFGDWGVYDSTRVLCVSYMYVHVHMISYGEYFGK